MRRHLPREFSASPAALSSTIRPSTVTIAVDATIAALRATHALLDAGLRSIANPDRDPDRNLSTQFAPQIDAEPIPSEYRTL